MQEVKILVTVFTNNPYSLMKSVDEYLIETLEEYFLAVNEKIKSIDVIKDEIVSEVVSEYVNRSEIGIKKYNTTLKDSNLSKEQLLQHLKEELMDATNYIQSLLK